MNYNNNNIIELDDDLQFVPLNIKEPFSCKDSKWIPLINFDSDSINNINNNFLLGFGYPVANNGMNSGLVSIPPVSVTKPQNIESPKNLSQTTDPTPSNNNLNNPNLGNIDLLYPSEIPADELYSYNSTGKCKANETPINIPNLKSSNTPLEKREYDEDDELIHMNILRNFDFSTDEIFDLRNSNCSNIDKIFKEIEANHSGIIGTFKAYRIPYPISALLVKKIIKLSLEYSEKE
ncbi:hypothetical protein [Clostridium chauvoei]|uniref:Uncharacterized protein n=2 Tax=Clostridium chauvoei TaxID=46867 RepID=S6FKM1_9CLOT|nr:hypothetical protein [Clostridium chauvoei]ATD54577.1 hypothetical protein BTM20_04745 [Clostridium chauvoei]ATD57742.1 hypothetical protein BTM21_08315 [Clostridium chauvoei]MBX7280987.1 hypothetical protein [Clostridium chauvoei]MBX7283511.1 hypothetical protein [Clostridium chauvoei]MBX7286076.1 hypothetical protein [Clostridium chauvoei]